MKRTQLFCSLLTVLFLLSACTYTGGIDNPLIRKSSWFSYLNGDDIRKVCPSLHKDRLRVIYNGVYQEQVRIYDVFFESEFLSGRILEDPKINEFRLDNIGNMLGGTSFELRLNPTELNVLSTLAKSTFAVQQIPKGTLLSSVDFYWTIQYCSGGEFYFTLKEAIIEDWTEFELGKFLLALDVSGKKINEPRNINRFERKELGETYNEFNVQMGENGLMWFN